MRKATYDRPVDAALHVHLANGEQFPATDKDLAKFGYVADDATYKQFVKHLHGALSDAGLVGKDITDAELNPVRHLLELFIYYPDGLAPADWPEADADVVRIERALQQHTKATQEMARLAAGWNERAATLRAKAAVAASPEYAQALEGEATGWSGAARELREQFETGAAK